MKNIQFLQLIKELNNRFNRVLCGFTFLVILIAVNKNYAKSVNAQTLEPQICTELTSSSLDATGLDSFFWKEKVIRVRFLDGAETFREKVRKIAPIWSQFANIRFEFIEMGSSDVRISFKPGGSWSYVGTNAKAQDESKPTMNFGWFDEKTTEDEFLRVILHEFGHLLGLVHEHQSPVAAINWKKDKVYKYYWRKFQWTANLVDVNIFKKYGKTQTQYTEYDSKSIMHYRIPEELITDGTPVGWNINLSDSDKAFIKKIYP